MNPLPFMNRPALDPFQEGSRGSLAHYQYPSWPVFSAQTKGGRGVRDFSRGNAGNADRRWSSSLPLRYPTFLRTEVRVPLSRAATTLNRFPAGEGLDRIFHTSIEWAPRRRVRARGLRRLTANACRPGPLSRRSACEILGLGAGSRFQWAANNRGGSR